MAFQTLRISSVIRITHKIFKNLARMERLHKKDEEI